MRRCGAMRLTLDCWQDWRKDRDQVVVVDSSAEVVAASGLLEDRLNRLNCLRPQLERFAAAAEEFGKCLKASAVWHYLIDRPSWLGWRQGVLQQVVDMFGLLRIEVEHAGGCGLEMAFLFALLEEQALLRSSVLGLGTRRIARCWLHLGDRRLAAGFCLKVGISYQALRRRGRLPGSVFGLQLEEETGG